MLATGSKNNAERLIHKTIKQSCKCWSLNVVSLVNYIWGLQGRQVDTNFLTSCISSSQLVCIMLL